MLDKKYGSIEAIVLLDTISPGSIIEYSIKKSQYYHMLDAINFLYMPLELAKKDMLFLHHVLEVCYFFAPPGSCVSGIFDLLQYVYVSQRVWQHISLKKLFLVKLLSTLGAYPESQQVHTPHIIRMLALNIDTLDDKEIQLAQEKELDTWLMHCIGQHPYIDEFKTVHFLNEHRIS